MGWPAIDRVGRTNSDVTAGGQLVEQVWLQAGRQSRKGPASDPAPTTGNDYGGYPRCRGGNQMRRGRDWLLCCAKAMLRRSRPINTADPRSRRRVRAGAKGVRRTRSKFGARLAFAHIEVHRTPGRRNSSTRHPGCRRACHRQSPITAATGWMRDTRNRRERLAGEGRTLRSAPAHGAGAAGGGR